MYIYIVAKISMNVAINTYFWTRYHFIKSSTLR